MKIKFVKKANQWCVTYFACGVQYQEWLGTKKEAKQFIKDKLKKKLENG